MYKCICLKNKFHYRNIYYNTDIDELFIVENVGNTWYIDLLSHLDNLFNKTLKNTNALVIYLQEYIKDKFVRNNKSIYRDDIEMIRLLCFSVR